MIHLPKLTPGRFLALSAGFLSAAACGWWLVADHPASAADGKGGAGLPTKSSSRDTRPARDRGPTALAKAQLQAIRQAGDSRERLRATLSLVHSLSLQELERWIRGGWFRQLGGYELSFFEKLAKERWLDEDPEGYLTWVLSHDPNSAHQAIAFLAEQDPARLLAFFQQHPNLDKEIVALSLIARKDPALALACYRELIAGSEQSLPGGSYGYKLLLALAESSPEMLEAALDSLPVGVSKHADALLIGERLKTDFAGELRQLQDRPDGLVIFVRELTNRRIPGLGDKLLAEFIDLPMAWKYELLGYGNRFISGDKAAGWLSLDYAAAGFNDAQATAMKTQACKVMFGTDPAAALRAMDAAGIPESFREEVFTDFLRWHGGDEAKTGELLALLTAEADREFVGEMIAKQRAELDRKAADRVLYETPAGWLERAAAFDAGTASVYELTSKLQNWSREEMAELRGQFQSLPEVQKRAVADVFGGENAPRGMVPEFQGDAIHYLISHPRPAEGEELGNATNHTAMIASQHAVRWGKEDPAAAGAWTATLPAGEPRLWAQKNLARNWADYDPAAARRWVASLPAADREAVDTYLKANR